MHVEKEFRLEFPAEYREFLLLANGGEGFIGSSAYVILYRAEELWSLNNSYGFPVHVPGLVLFGSDGGGEAFCFDASTPGMPIVQVPFVGMARKTTSFFAASFAAFLEALYRIKD